MASQLIDEMTVEWKPSAYSEQFSSSIRALLKRKVAAGEAKQVEPLESGEPSSKAANVVDLTDLLAKSLAGRGPAAARVAGGDSAPARTGRSRTQARRRGRSTSR
jgi:DNA end-binding protein Ku